MVIQKHYLGSLLYVSKVKPKTNAYKKAGSLVSMSIIMVLKCFRDLQNMAFNMVNKKHFLVDLPAPGSIPNLQRRLRGSEILLELALNVAKVAC